MRLVTDSIVRDSAENTISLVPLMEEIAKKDARIKELELS